MSPGLALPAPSPHVTPSLILGLWKFPRAALPPFNTGPSRFWCSPLSREEGAGSGPVPYSPTQRPVSARDPCLLGPFTLCPPSFAPESLPRVPASSCRISTSGKFSFRERIHLGLCGETQAPGNSSGTRACRGAVSTRGLTDTSHAGLPTPKGSWSALKSLLTSACFR